MVHIQNATLAGGVAIGSAAALKIAPGAALGVGLVAGIISTLGFSYSTAFFERLLGLADTCGVQNLHGAPGVVGGFASAILVAVYAQENADMLEHSGSHQAGMQVAGLLATIAVAGAGGLVCGALVGYTNLPAVGGEPVDIEELYDDAALIKGD